MPSSAPIFSYSAPTPRQPINLGILLILWSIFDLLAGLCLTVTGWCVLDIVRNNPLVLIAVFVLLFGPTLIIWSICTFVLAVRILKSDLSALHRAMDLTIIAEIATWILFLLFWLIIGLNIDLIYPPASFAILFCLITLFLPLAVTLTRILLRRAARRLPPIRQFPQCPDPSMTH